MNAVKPFDMDRWLGELGLAVYAPAFQENNIDADLLASLTSDDLREIGVTSVGHRRRILDAAAKLNADPQPLPETPAAEPAEASPALAAERRHLTVMFCDLVDSTALSIHADAEDYREFIGLYRTVLQEAIRPHHGYVAHFMGDGVLVYFGYPVSFEHDAESAVEAAFAVIQKVAAMAPFAGTQPCVRIGIATGMTIVGSTSRERELSGDSVVGETPNLAARLQALATPNAVIVAPATRELLGDLYDIRDLGLFDLKGFDQQTRAWQVLTHKKGDRFEAVRTGRRITNFIDRESELTRLRQWAAAARAGRGQFAVISGEGGVGKSRLARQIVDEVNVRRRQQPILQCTSYNVGTPFHPIRYYIEQISGLDPRDTPDVALQKLSVLLSRAGPVQPEGTALLAELTRVSGADLGPLQGVAPPERRQRTMRLLMTLMEAIFRASDAIVIEDIQWIDPSTIELIEKLLPTIRSLPVIVVATMRPAPFPAWLSSANARLLQLEPLPNAEACALVRAAAQGNELAPAVVEAIALRSDGIPIFAEELTRGYVEAAGSEHAGDDELSHIPASLEDSLLARLDRLKQGRRVASIAAAIGREFPIAILIAISDLPEAEVRASIGELLDADVLVPGHSPFGEAVAFRHLLVRDAAYQLLLRKERNALHIRISETLTNDFPNIASALPQVIAIQLNAAGEFARAAAAWDQAGTHAAERSAYSEAIAHYTRAIEANSGDADSRARDERTLSYRLKLIGALIAARGFSSESVAEEMQRATELSHKLGTAAKLIPILASNWIVTASTGNVRAAHELALQLRHAAEGGSTVDRLLAHRTLGTSLLFSGMLLRAMEEFEQFLALYKRERDEAALRGVGASDPAVMSMIGLAEVYTLFGEFETADRWRHKALEAARDVGSHTLCSATMFCGCFVPAVRQQYDEIGRYSAELKSLCRQFDLPFWRGHADLFGGLALIREGHDDEGFVEARRGVKQLIAAHAYGNGLYILYAETCERGGRLAEAGEALDRALAPLEHGEMWLAAEYHRVRGRLALARNHDAAEARKCFETALLTAETQGARLFSERARIELSALETCIRAVRPSTGSG